MSVELEVIPTWASPSASGALHPLSITTLERGSGDTLRATVALPTSVLIRARSLVRLTSDHGGEYRVTRVSQSEDGQSLSFDAIAPIADLATAGLIRAVQAGRLQTAFGGSLTIRDWLANYVLTALTADGLTWLDTTLGAVEDAQLYTLAFDRWTRLELLRALESASGLELVCAQPSPGALYRLGYVVARGSAAPIAELLPDHPGLVARTDEQSADGFASVVLPLLASGSTDAPSTIADHAFQVAAIASGWVTITDPQSATSPIAFDDQLNDAYLVWYDGVTRMTQAVLDSDAATGRVQVASTTTLTVGKRVQFAVDADGGPYTQLRYPAAVAESGLVTAPLEVSGARPEHNVLANADFALGAAGWGAIGGSSWLEPMPASESAQITGQTNGAVTVGPPASMLVKNFPANAVLRRGEAIQGKPNPASVIAASAVFVPSTGKMTVPITVATSGGLAHGTPMFDGWVDGDLTAGASSIPVQRAAWAYLRTPAFTAGSPLVMNYGGTYFGVVDSSGALWTNGTASPTEETLTGALTTLGGMGSLDGTAHPPQPTADWILEVGRACTVQGVQITGSVTWRIGTNYTGGTTVDLIATLAPGASVQFPVSSSTWQFQCDRSETHGAEYTGSTVEYTLANSVTVTFTPAIPVGWTTGANPRVSGLLATAPITASPFTAGREAGVVSVAAGTAAPLPGAVLYVNETVTLSGTGTGTVQLRPAGVLALGGNTDLAVLRNPTPYPTTNIGGTMLVRAGGANATGWRSDPQIVPVWPGSTRPVLAAFVCHVYAPYWPEVADYGLAPPEIALTVRLVDENTGLTLATVTTAYAPLTAPLPGSLSSGVITFEGRCLGELTATAFVRIEAQPMLKPTYKASASLAWSIQALGACAMAVATDDPELPFFLGAGANAGWHAATRYLRVWGKLPTTYDATFADFVTTDLEIGQQAVLDAVGTTRRIVEIERDHLARLSSRLVLDTLPPDAARLLAGGRAVASGSGSVVMISGGSSGTGSGGGGTSTAALSVLDSVGGSVPSVTSLRFEGVDVSVRSGGSGIARVAVPVLLDEANASASISGGEWVVRDLVAAPGYGVTIAAGRGVIEGHAVDWPTTTVFTPAANSFLVVTSDGTVQARPASAPEALPAHDALLLHRTYVEIGTYGNRIYAVADSRTWRRTTPRGPLRIAQRIRDSVVASGVWAGALAVNATGYVNFYFANLALYPMVEEMPAVVEAHLAVQVAKFYGASGTGSTDWTALHGTTWAAGYLKWPYDVEDPRGTPVKRRADSHDAYAGTFLRLAARYAATSAAGLAWWDANYTAIKDCFYNNLIVPQRSVNVGAGYMTETFQDATVYPFCQTLDTIESWRGLQDAFDMMVSRGGTQATDAAYYQGFADNLKSGVQSMYRAAAPNVRGEVEWLSIRWNNASAAIEPNDLQLFYPDLTMPLGAALYDCALHGTASIAQDRLAHTFRHLHAYAPRWFASREYDLFPWGMIAAAAARMGFRDLAERWLTFVQTHHAHDAPGYLYCHDLGWARYVERILAGDDLR